MARRDIFTIFTDADQVSLRPRRYDYYRRKKRGINVFCTRSKYQKGSLLTLLEVSGTVQNSTGEAFGESDR